MPKYNIHVADRPGGEQTVYGPFESYADAHEAGMVYARQGKDVELQAADGSLVCDFCSTTEVKWAYEVGDFQLPDPSLEWGSRGSWAACDACHDLIEKGDPHELALHSLRTFFTNRPEVPDVPEIRSQVYEHVRIVHKEFWQRMTGKVTPV